MPAGIQRELPNFAKSLESIGIIKTSQTDNNYSVVISYLNYQTSNRLLRETPLENMDTTNVGVNSETVLLEESSMEEVTDVKLILNEFNSTLKELDINEKTVYTINKKDLDIRKKIVTKIHLSINDIRDRIYSAKCYVMANYRMLCFINNWGDEGIIRKFHKNLSFEMIVNDTLEDEIIVGCLIDKENMLTGPVYYLFNEGLTKSKLHFIANANDYFERILIDRVNEEPVEILNISTNEFEKTTKEKIIKKWEVIGGVVGESEPQIESNEPGYLLNNKLKSDIIKKWEDAGLLDGSMSRKLSTWEDKDFQFDSYGDKKQKSFDPFEEDDEEDLDVVNDDNGDVDTVNISNENGTITNRDVFTRFYNYVGLKVRLLNPVKVVSNAAIMSVISDDPGFVVNALSNRFSSDDPNIKYNYGKWLGKDFFVDPLMRWDDKSLIFLNENEDEIYKIVVNDENNLLI